MSESRRDMGGLKARHTVERGVGCETGRERGGREGGRERERREGGREETPHRVGVTARHGWLEGTTHCR